MRNNDSYFPRWRTTLLSRGIHLDSPLPINLPQATPSVDQSLIGLVRITESIRLLDATFVIALQITGHPLARLP